MATDTNLRVRQATCRPMAAAQATTNSYVTVDDSIIDARDRSAVSFVVTETGASNGITAAVVGRFVSDQPERVDGLADFSGWQTVVAGTAISTDSTGTLQVPAGGTRFDEYAVQVKSTVADSAGAAQVWGSAREDQGQVEQTTTLSPVSATLTAGAEAADAIEVTVQASVAASVKYLAEIRGADGLLAVVGAYTMAETGTGTGISTTAKPSLIFSTSVLGAAVITVTDVAGASDASVYLVLTPLDHLGLPTYISITFDNA